MMFLFDEGALNTKTIGITWDISGFEAFKIGVCRFIISIYKNYYLLYFWVVNARNGNQLRDTTNQNGTEPN